MEELEQLSTEDLQQLLREDFEGKSKDPRQVQAVLEILQRREGHHEEETQVAWQELQTYFHTPDGKDLALFPTETPAQRKKSILLRGIAAAAVLVVVFLGTILPAVGEGSFRSFVGRWSGTAFWFDGKATLPEDPDIQSPGYHGDHPDLQRLHKEISKHAVSPVMPCWIPEGYAIEDWDDFTVFHSSDETSEKYELAANFTRGEDTLNLRIFISKQVPNVVYGKDDTEITIYRKNGTEYHIMSDHGSYTCAWQNGSSGGYISGDITPEELYHMIDSIYTGG